MRWQWQNDSGGFTPYAPHVITAIERAYALKQGKFDIPQSRFRIVFSQMIQVFVCIYVCFRVSGVHGGGEIMQ